MSQPPTTALHFGRVHETDRVVQYMLARLTDISSDNARFYKAKTQARILNRAIENMPNPFQLNADRS